jgi:hypothetical protein
MDQFKRLGAGALGSKNDINALKDHLFFKDIKFNQIFLEKSPIFL